MLLRAKLFCSNDTLFLKEVIQFGFLVLVNNCTSKIFDKVFEEFMVINHFLLDQFFPDNEKDIVFEKKI